MKNKPRFKKRKNNSYIRIATFPVKQLLPLMCRHVKEKFKGILEDKIIEVEVKMYSHRYELYKARGTKCVNCGIEGTYFALEAHQYNSRNKLFHFNLYGTDKNGNEIMITKDHIIPKSLGGPSNLDNYQVLCCKCNSKKSNKLEEDITYVDRETTIYFENSTREERI